MNFFIGLGPNGNNVSETELMEFLNSSEELGACVNSVRARGSCAFATLTDTSKSDVFLHTFNGRILKECRLAVQVARDSASGGNDRRGPRRDTDGLTVFIGLGPQASTVDDDQLRTTLEQGGQLSGPVRRRGQCAFADFMTAEDAQRAVDKLHGVMLGDCRLSVQMSKRDRNNNNDRFNGGGGRGRMEERKRDRSRSRRRRSDSREHRRRHRSDSEDRHDRRRRRSDSRDSRDRRDRRERRD